MRVRAAERALTLARRKEKGMAAEQPTAIVLLSGGLDSSTALALAAEQGFALYALSFRYGQRHARELEASSRLPPPFCCPRHQILSAQLAPFRGPPPPSHSRS